MARHIKNTGLESRTARAKLKGGKIHRQSLGGNLSIGWRRGAKGAGVWIARLYLGAQKYVTAGLGEADDLADADGSRVFNYGQVQTRARQWALELDRAQALTALGPAITVKAAIGEYVDVRGPTGRDAFTKLRHVLKSPLAGLELAALTAEDLGQWGAELRRRMGEASARRVSADFKAALNAAAKRYRGRLPASIRDTIKDGLAVPRGAVVENSRPKQILDDSDIRRLLSAARTIDERGEWGGALYRLMLVLAATGARFSQVARLTVSDLQVAEARLMIPLSRKGTGARTGSTAVPIGPDVVALLEPCARGRKGHEPLLTRPYWRRTPGPMWGKLEVYETAAWRVGGTLGREWLEIVRLAGLPPSTVIYSLRHSSIARQLRRGLPIQLVARLHNSSATMIERFYGAHVVSAFDDLARAALVDLAPTPVATIRAVERG